jgi:hypothetical protein
MVSSVNSYVNPFSEGAAQSRKDFSNLGLAARVFTVFLTALAWIVTIPFLGIAGYAVFKGLVDRFQPIKNGENPVTDKIKAVAKDQLSKQTGSASSKQSISEQPKHIVHVETVEQLISEMKTELDFLEKYVNSDDLSKLVESGVQAKGVLKQACLGDLATAYNENHFQIMESVRTAKDLIAHSKKAQQSDLIDQIQLLEAKCEQLLKKHSDAFKAHQEQIGAIFLEVHQSLQIDLDAQLKKAHESTLIRLDKMMEFVTSFFESIEKSDPSNYASVDVTQYQSYYDWFKGQIVSLLPGQQVTPQDEKKPTYWHEFALKPAKEFHLKIKKERNQRLIETMKASQQTTGESLTPPENQQGVKTPPKPVTADAKSKASAKPFFSLFNRTQVQPGGIPNLGNTCYMNSSLQVIMNTSLAQLIDQDIEEPQWSDFSEIQLGDEELVGLQQQYQQNPSSIENLELRKAMGLFCEACEDYPRVAAHLKALQTFKAVYEGRKTDMSIREAARIVHGVVWDAKTRLVQLRGSMYSQQDAAELMTAALRAIGYRFNMRSLVKSADGIDRSYQEEAYSYLSLPLVNGKSTLRDLLETYKTENINDSKNVWNIEEYGNVVRQHQQYSKTLTIVGEIPDVMVIQLKRFRSDMSGRMLSKDTTPITIDDEVDLGVIIDDELKREGVSTRYRVVAHVDHGGGLGGGHYTADVKIGDNWHYRSDSSASPVSEQDEKRHRATAYIYVLERIK